MKHRTGLLTLQGLLYRVKLKDFDPLERPAVGIGYGFDFRVRLRESDIKTGLFPPYTLKKELKAERRLAHARVTLDEIEAA